jgi:P-type Mg2+ transporter
MKLSEFLRCPIKVQRCAGRIEQKELIVQVDHMDVVPGDIVIFEPGDLFPGDIRLLSSKHLVVRYLSRKIYSNRKQFACQLTKCHLVISLTS